MYREMKICCFVENRRRVLFDREVTASNDLLSFISGTSPITGCADGWIWRATKEGMYTTKSAYEVIKGLGNEALLESCNRERLAKIWNIQAPQKTRVTTWRILRDRLPTCENLRKRNIPLGEEEIMCNACCQHLETTNHLLLSCPKTEKVWIGIHWWLGIKAAWPQSVEAHFDLFTNLDKGNEGRLFLATVWVCTTWLLWKRRNESRFEGKNWEINDVIEEVKVRMWSWNKIFGLLDKEISSQAWFSCVFPLALV
ncbi:uncharacterized protein LOC130998000 [Salvia miltiorrhiza]|uniref:uncharacterized protein LOC130998000 n=1 Tax=Salvia miltiorrhiza TaxID=226208 RepID=UPI0025AD93B5|nr:uncharacterized protein LOC130998000 [Salvia miltiorrhiza]